jgi:hypothetical protein
LFGTHKLADLVNQAVEVIAVKQRLPDLDVIIEVWRKLLDEADGICDPKLTNERS